MELRVDFEIPESGSTINGLIVGLFLHCYDYLDRARSAVAYFFSRRREETAFGQDFSFLPDAESLPLGSGAISRKTSGLVHALAADTGVWTSKYVTSTRAPEK